MTKEEFRKAWGTEVVTWGQLADIAKEWGIAEKPRCMRCLDIRYLVLKAANIPDAEEYNPDYLEYLECIENN